MPYLTIHQDPDESPSGPTHCLWFDAADEYSVKRALERARRLMHLQVETAVAAPCFHEFGGSHRVSER